MNTVIRNVLLGGLLWLTIPLAAQVSQDVIDKAKAAGMTEDQIRQEIAKRMGQSGAEQSGLERAVSGTGHAGGLFQGCEIYME